MEPSDDGGNHAYGSGNSFSKKKSNWQNWIYDILSTPGADCVHWYCSLLLVSPRFLLLQYDKFIFAYAYEILIMSQEALRSFCKRDAAYLRHWWKICDLQCRWCNTRTDDDLGATTNHAENFFLSPWSTYTGTITLCQQRQTHRIRTCSNFFLFHLTNFRSTSCHRLEMLPPASGTFRAHQNIPRVRGGSRLQRNSKLCIILLSHQYRQFSLLFCISWIIMTTLILPGRSIAPSSLT